MRLVLSCWPCLASVGAWSSGAAGDGTRGPPIAQLIGASAAGDERSGSVGGHSPVYQRSGALCAQRRGARKLGATTADGAGRWRHGGQPVTALAPAASAGLENERHQHDVTAGTHTENGRPRRAGPVPAGPSAAPHRPGACPRAHRRQCGRHAGNPGPRPAPTGRRRPAAARALLRRPRPGRPRRHRRALPAPRPPARRALPAPGGALRRRLPGRVLRARQGGRALRRLPRRRVLELRRAHDHGRDQAPLPRPHMVRARTARPAGARPARRPRRRRPHARARPPAVGRRGRGDRRRDDRGGARGDAGLDGVPRDLARHPSRLGRRGRGRDARRHRRHRRRRLPPRRAAGDAARAAWAG